MRKFILILLIMLLAACTPAANPEPAAPAVAVTVERPTQAPPPTATLTPLPIPQATSTPDVAAFTPTPVPSPTAVANFGSPIPENLSRTFTVVDQLGGSARAVAATTERIYLGMGPRLLVLDTSLNLLGTSAPLAGTILDIAVDGNVAYLALGGSGMTAVNIADPANPTPLGSLDILHSTRSHIDAVVVLPSSIVLRNNVDGQTSMIQVDVTNPAEPVQTLITAAPAQANLTASDTAVYAVAADAIAIYDPVASDLTAPVANVPIPGGGYGLDLLVRDNLAYLLQSGGAPGVVIYDVTNPRQPQAVSELLPIGGFAASQAVLTANGLVTFGSMGEFGFCGASFSAVRLADPLQPEIVDGWDEPNCVYDIAASPDGRFLYSAGQRGLRVYDVTDLAAPAEVSHFEYPFHKVETAVVHNDRVYAIAPNGQEYRLATASLMDGDLDFTTIKSVALPDTAVANLLISGDTLLPTRWAVGFFTLDASDPNAAPAIVAEPPLDDSIYGDRFANIIGDGILFAPISAPATLQDIQGGIVAYDIHDPANPTRIGVLDLGLRTIDGLVYENGRLYATITGETTTLAIVDATDPTNLTLISETELPRPANRLTVVDGVVFMACSWSCADLFIFDAADPANPALLGSHTLPRPASSLTYDPARQLLYATAFRDDTLALDVGDPTQPVIVASTPISGQITVLDDGLLLIAAEDDGLYTVQVTP